MNLQTAKDNLATIAAFDISPYPLVKGMRVRVVNPYKRAGIPIADFSKVTVIVDLLMVVPAGQRANAQHVDSVIKHLVFHADEDPTATALPAMTAACTMAATYLQALVGGQGAGAVSTQDAAISATQLSRPVPDGETDIQ